MIHRYTVIGQPIAHSLSPVVHQLFGELTQRKIHYTRTEATPETFADTVIEWQQSGAHGCNVTAPFKELAVDVCNRLSTNAKRAGSVNTIHMHRDGSRAGYNTDGVGLVTDIQSNLRRPLASQRILLLGAGGAARGVMAPLLAVKPALLHVANRTASKGEHLASLFEDLGPVSGGGFEQLAGFENFDIVINATTLSMNGGMPPLPEDIISHQSLAYDMTYSSRDTVFMLWSKARGASVSNGLGMLVEQAAEAFFIWEGVRPKTRMVYPRLRELLS